MLLDPITESEGQKLQGIVQKKYDGMYIRSSRYMGKIVKSATLKNHDGDRYLIKKPLSKI